MRRTKEEARRTRESILDAALRLFCARGYSATGLGEIAAEAGVTRGAIYWHFGDKADLFARLFRERAARAGSAVNIVFSPKLGPVGTLRRFLVSALEAVEVDPEYRALMKLNLLMVEDRPELEAGAGEQVSNLRSQRRFIAGLLREGVRRGELREDLDPDLAALTVVGFMTGMISQWLLDEESFSLRSEASALVGTLIGGLAEGR